MRVLLIVIGLPAGLALFGLDGRTGDAERGAGRRSASLRCCSSVSTVVAVAHAADAVSRRPDVRRDGRLGGFCTAPVFSPCSCRGGSAAPRCVTLGAVAGSRFANTSPRMLLELSRRSLRLVRGRGRRRGLLRAARRGVAAVSVRRRDRRVRAGCAGHHDGAGARAAPRSGLCRRAPSRAVPGGQLLGGRSRPARMARAHRALEAAGQGTFDD